MATMPNLDAAQIRNCKAAISQAPSLAAAERLAFGMWSEGRCYNYANDGRNTSRSPGFDKNPHWVAILRLSLNYAHDKVGSNGRSTGILQQISSDVDGGWGSRAGTLDPAISARRFLAALKVTDDSVYSGTLLTSSGSRKVKVQLSDAIAADVLRVQQPLADEAESSNYNGDQVAIAKWQARQFWVQTSSTSSSSDTLAQTGGWWSQWFPAKG